MLLYSTDHPALISDFVRFTSFPAAPQLKSSLSAGRRIKNKATPHHKSTYSVNRLATPAYVYSQFALPCYLLISEHSSKRKPAVHTSVTTGLFFPHCLRLHHSHSGTGTCWHCWSVLFDRSYC